MTPDSTDLSAGRADRYSLLSECLKHPTDRFIQQVGDGTLEIELRAHADTFEDGDRIATVADARTDDLRTQYRSLFEAFKQPYAPPAESPYKNWYGDRDGGLMGGPSATDMQRRYAAIDATPPESYPADHIALLLEYASLLLESDAIEEYEAFLVQHFDWIPAFRRLTDRAAADAPFYRAIVELTEAVVSVERDRHGIDDPTAETIEAMVDRVWTDGPSDSNSWEPSVSHPNR